MTTERSEHSGTDNRLAETDLPGTIEGGPAIVPDAQPANSDTAAHTARARERAAEAGAAVREGSRKVTGAASKAASGAQRSIPVPVRHTAGRVTAHARRLTGHTAAWARRNPKAMAGAVAGAAATGLAAWRRITRRRQR
jgi:hypothetical protein